MPSLKNITWERLEREESVTYPCDAPDRPGNAIIFGDRFPTESGRAKIVPAKVTAPAELPDLDYPMILTTGRLLEHWHTGSMTRRASSLDALEPEAIAGLNRWDMKRMEVQAGDYVQVTTRRGTVTLKARQDVDVPEGMIFIPFCFGRRRPTADQPASIRWARSLNSNSAPQRSKPCGNLPKSEN